MAALAHEHHIRTEFLGFLDIELVVGLHVGVAAGEQPVVGPVEALGAHGPLLRHSHYVEHFRQAHGGLRVDQHVARGRDVEVLGALHVDRNLDGNAVLFLHLFFEEVDRCPERLRTGPVGVARLQRDIDPPLHRLGGHIQLVQNSAALAGDDRMVDAERAERGAAPAARTLVEVRFPVLQVRRVEVRCPGESPEQPAGGRAVFPVDAPDQVGALDRVVALLALAEVDRADRGAGPALGTHLHVHAHGPRTVPDGLDGADDFLFDVIVRHPLVSLLGSHSRFSLV